MAIDEALLASVAAGGAPALRFYQWARPTLSLGYFQAAADRTRHPASAMCDLVRRSSGGGAILHDLELTYSLTLPQTGRPAGDRERLYRLVHQALAAVLGELLPAKGSKPIRLRAEVPPAGSGADRFLCFQRASVGDLLHGETKIAGSAQRRVQGAVLQHGSILLAASECAPELPGIAELAETKIDAGEVADRAAAAIAHVMGLELHGTALAESELQSAQQLESEKHTAPSWTLRR